MKKPKYLWHGSTREYKLLKPLQATDLTGDPESNFKAVYATDIKELAIGFGLVDKVFQKFADYSKKPVQMVVIDGDIRRGKYFYLYKLSGKGFIEMPEGSHQWACFSEVKPIEVIKLKVDDYKYLARKATKRDKELFESRIGMFS